MKARSRAAAAVALTMALATTACGGDTPTSATKDTKPLRCAERRYRKPIFHS